MTKHLIHGERSPMTFPPHIDPPTTEDVKGASGMARVAARDWEKYKARSTRIADLVTSKISEFEVGTDASSNILDWGSALGGASIVLSERFDATVYAADLDKHSMRWLSNNCPEIRTQALDPEGALPFVDGLFDLVFGISVFTHIPERLTKFYIDELARTIKPGGIMLQSFHGYHNVENVAKGPKEKGLYPSDVSSLKDAGVYFKSYSAEELSLMDFTSKTEYGIATHSKEYLLDAFGSHFDVLSIDEGQRPLVTQDLYVFRKRA
jgi:SAM-dependent methyltransferase